MTFLIAALVIYGLALPGWLYVVAAVVWGVERWMQFNLHSSLIDDIRRAGRRVIGTD